jgi:exonuclease VII small subunit
VVLCGSLLSAGCKGSPKERAEKLSQTQQSWEETVRLTTELWQKGAVPSEYARQTLDAAREALDQVRRSAEQLSP